MRTFKGFLVIALVLLVGLGGCTTIEENPRTAIGAGVGAAGGAVAGGLIGGSATGAVIGGLLGGLAGGAVGQYLDRQERSATQAKAETGYTAAQGNVLRVERVQVDPAAVRPGAAVNLGATYTLLTPNPNDTLTVQETREVRHDGVLVANPAMSIARPNGTFTSVLPITLPPGAARGTYEVTTTVAAGDRSSRGFTTFVVQ